MMERLRAFLGNYPALGLAAALLGAAVWLLHEVCMALWPPMENPFDTGMRVLACLLKAGCLVLMLPSLYTLHQRVYHDPRRAALAFILLVGFFVGAAALYLPFRESFAVRTVDDAARFYFTDPGSPLAEWGYNAGLEPWREAWGRGIPQAKEFGLLLLVSLLAVVPGLFVRRHWLTALFSWVTMGVAVFYVPLYAGLVDWDYDIFFGGIFFDSLCLEVFPVCWFWATTATIILFLCVALFQTVVLITCRRPGQTALGRAE